VIKLFAYAMLTIVALIAAIYTYFFYFWEIDMKDFDKGDNEDW